MYQLSTPLHKSDQFNATYRTQDGELLVEYICVRNAGSQKWKVMARYGDAEIAEFPENYHSLGLKFLAANRTELTPRLAELAEVIWKNTNPALQKAK